MFVVARVLSIYIPSSRSEMKNECIGSRLSTFLIIYVSHIVNPILSYKQVTLMI